MAGDQDTEKRIALAEAQASGLNVTEAAKVAGFSRRHAYRLQGDADFVRMLEARRRQREEAPAPVDVDERLALEALREVARSGESETARVAAAKELRAVAAERRRAAPSGAAPSEPVAAKPAGSALASAKAFLRQHKGGKQA